MKRLMVGVCCGLALITACGELSTPNSFDDPESASTAFTHVESASAAFTHVGVNYFNRPFVTVDETVGLYGGMSTNSVLNLCGKPLYVSEGSAEKVVWVYIVRELLVGNESGTRVLVKNSDLTMFSSTLHYLALSFEFGELANWSKMSADGTITSILPAASEEEEE